MGSASPMVQKDVGPHSPLLGAEAGAAAAGGILGAGAAGHERRRSAGSIVSPDGTSSVSGAHGSEGAGPFTGADAAIMADAFRQALRKPDFASRPVEEGESPEAKAEDSEESGGTEKRAVGQGHGLLSQELADEGRDIRSVSSSRGVTIEGGEGSSTT